MFLCVYKDWNDKQGVKHTTAEIQANLLQMLGGHTGNGYAPQSQPQSQPLQQAPQNPSPYNDEEILEIPF